MNSSIQAALFDLDGVVFDTEGQYTEFYNAIGREYVPDVPDFAYQIKGQTLSQIFDKWFSQFPERQKDIIRRINRLEQQMDYTYVPGFLDFIQILRDSNIKTAVVTSSNLPKMNSVCRARPEFRQLFDEILTAEDFTASKPDPDGYIKAAKRFNARPHHCVVFEDSINGLLAGKNAGSFVVGLATTNPRETVSKYANLIIDDFTELTLQQLETNFTSYLQG